MTEEQKQFIIDHWSEMSAESLRKLFNETFGTEYKTTAFHYHTNRMGLSKHIEHQYTEEEDEFLKFNSAKMSRKELTDLFNETFGTQIKLNTIIVRCLKLGCNAPSDGQFKKGSVPWSKTQGGREEYVKTLKGGNSCSFRKGNIPFNCKPVGTESFRQISCDPDDKELFVKTDEGWVPKRKFIWEQHNGKVPEGFLITSVDGDKFNYDMGNLRMVDNLTLTILVSNKWNDKGAEIFDTGVVYSKLYALLKEQGYDRNKINKVLLD